jgi:hypothetical protein
MALLCIVKAINNLLLNSFYPVKKNKMIITDLDYIETISEDIEGGRSFNQLYKKSPKNNVNQVSIATAVAISIGGPATAVAIAGNTSIVGVG